MENNKHTAKFIVINTMLISLLGSAWWAGFFDGFLNLHGMEYAMMLFLLAYFMIGIISSLFKKWEIVRHIANGLPMWALVFTGIGIINAAIGLANTETDTLLIVFKNLALAISPNIVGVFLMIWLREIALWCGHEET
jgi:hypothetical protein